MNAQAAKFQLRFLYPSLLKTWVYFALWRIAVFLPFGALLGLGKLVGLFLYKLPTHRKHIVKTNIELCFPELDKQQQADLLRANFINMGIAIMEIGMAWWWPKKRFSKLLNFEGLENLQCAEGQGIILLAFITQLLKLVLRVFQRCVIEMVCIVLTATQSMIIFNKGRLHKSTGNSRLYERRDVRGTMKALKSGRTVWYAPDQDYGMSRCFCSIFRY